MFDITSMLGSSSGSYNMLPEDEHIKLLKVNSGFLPENSVTGPGSEHAAGHRYRVWGRCSAVRKVIGTAPSPALCPEPGHP